MQTPRTNLTPIPLRGSTSAPETPAGREAVAIYRPFFLAGVVTVLTVGCLLGALALVGVAMNGSYTASVWTPYVLAHANSQLFGWVGFFVMGFSLQQHATTHAHRVAFHRWSYAALATMSAGIILRFAAEPLAQSDPARWVWLGVVSGCLQLLAFGLFVTNITLHRDKGRGGLTWPSLFVFASLACWLIATVAEPYVFVATHQTDRLASIGFVAEWFTPLRELQFLGFVAMMIFGVASSKFQGCLGFQKTNPAWGIAGFGLWSVGLVLRMAGWKSFFAAGMAVGTDTSFRLGALLLFLGACAVTLSLGVFKPLRQRNNSQKFIRSAFAWLLLAGAMLAFEPIHLNAIGAPFSHAFTGAIRHAVTVGFISQMIIAVGFHLATRVASIDESTLPDLWAVWWLLNLGNLGRVSLEVATDYFPAAFAPMGATGFIELAGIALWGSVMVRILVVRRRSYATVC